MGKRALKPCHCGTVHGGFDDIHPHCEKARSTGLREGADRERRRIRRAFLAQLKGFIGPATKLDIMEFVDAATRRPRKRK